MGQRKKGLACCVGGFREPTGERKGKRWLPCLLTGVALEGAVGDGRAEISRRQSVTVHRGLNNGRVAKPQYWPN